MNSKQKLELTWIGKDIQPRLEPRILIEDPDKSFGDRNTDNMLIHGDNLLALKALEQDFAGKVKCVFIDPPYNTGSAFEHYDDGLEHSLWLSLMRDRLNIIRRLLSEAGSLWITIDDNEAHYLKVLCDEVLGRRNFICNVIWQKRTSRENRAAIGSSHDHILVYSNAGALRWKDHRNLLPASEEGFSNPDNDPRGAWRSIPFSAQGWRPNQMYKIETPTGILLDPPKGRCWGATEEVFKAYLSEGRVYFPRGGSGRPRIKTYVGEEKGLVPNSIFLASEAGDNQAAKKEILTLFPDDEAFDTPKPEKLLRLVLSIATNPGDLVLDSFLGSGTTAAVAHKMGRRWIGIELGEHCHTHCIPRLRKVCEGTDQGGISKAVNWKRGGGFKYYYLAPSLLKQDTRGNWVIDERYNADMLAAAMAKHEGFKYSPNQEVYWKQGQSTEKDYIFTTTSFVSVAFLDQIHEEMRDDESLLICCRSFSKACESRYSSITVKKIPNMLLGRCEFGREDYSLNIITMPVDNGGEGATSALDWPDGKPDENNADEPEGPRKVANKIGTRRQKKLF